MFHFDLLGSRKEYQRWSNSATLQSCSHSRSAPRSQSTPTSASRCHSQSKTTKKEEFRKGGTCLAIEIKDFEAVKLCPTTDLSHTNFIKIVRGQPIIICLAIGCIFLCIRWSCFIEEIEKLVVILANVRNVHNFSFAAKFLQLEDIISH
jgi:hypothetical protein